MKKRSICFITDRYPTKEYPVNTFFDKLICAIADSGIKCTVIAPYSPIADIIKKNNYHPPKQYVKRTKHGSEIKVYCPKIFAFTNRKMFGINFTEIYQKQFSAAIKNIIEKNKEEFSAFYGHFILPSGLAAVELGNLYGKPSFIANGESSLESLFMNIDKELLKEKLKNVNGIISVSTKNKEEIIRYGIVEPEKVKVFVNAIDSDEFFCVDKNKARDELGFNENDFIVAFVGHFINRKGSKRVSEAIKHIDGIKSLFIGRGPEEPDCEGILYKGVVSHEEIYKYLNAADVFVLPTLAEGCCNAIIEAMACGLPIISSNLSFNDDILDETCSIRINPNNIFEIKEAILKIKNNPTQRKEISLNALKKAAEFTIDKRAEKIVKFMEL